MCLAIWLLPAWFMVVALVIRVLRFLALASHVACGFLRLFFSHFLACFSGFKLVLVSSFHGFSLRTFAFMCDRQQACLPGLCNAVWIFDAESRPCRSESIERYTASRIGPAEL